MFNAHLAKQTYVEEIDDLDAELDNKIKNRKIEKQK